MTIKTGMTRKEKIDENAKLCKIVMDETILRISLSFKDKKEFDNAVDIIREHRIDGDF